MASLPTYVAQFDSLYDLPVADVARAPFRTPRTLTLDLGAHGVATIPPGAAVFPGDILVFEILRKNAGRRPIAWSVTAADALYGLSPHLVQQGLALVLPVIPADPATLDRSTITDSLGVALDVVATRRIVDAWQFGALEVRGPDRLDANIRAVAATLAGPITRTGLALAHAGDTTAAVALLRRAARVASDSTARAVLRGWGRQGPGR
jgi:hypothetical protein